MKLYRVVVLIEIEAEDEEAAVRFAEDEISQSAFEGVLSVTEVEVCK